MRACILAAAICILLPSAATAQSPWQRTPGNPYGQASGPVQRIGPGYHVVGPTAALLRSSDNGPWHYLGPVAALLRLFGGGGSHYLGPKATHDRRFGPSYHVVGPTAALSRRPGGVATRQGIAE